MTYGFQWVCERDLIRVGISDDLIAIQMRATVYDPWRAVAGGAKDFNLDNFRQQFDDAFAEAAGAIEQAQLQAETVLLDTLAAAAADQRAWREGERVSA